MAANAKAQPVADLAAARVKLAIVQLPSAASTGGTQSRAFC